MAVILGSDGAVKIDLGDGLKYIAQIRSWEAALSRPSLRRTTMADEAEKRASGVADWGGNFELQIVLSEDDSTALSAWKLLQFLLAGVDEGLKADVELILQRYQISADCVTFGTSLSGVVKLAGTVLLTDVRLDCQSPEEALVLVVYWEGDGALGLVRDP